MNRLKEQTKLDEKSDEKDVLVSFGFKVVEILDSFFSRQNASIY